MMAAARGDRTNSMISTRQRRRNETSPVYGYRYVSNI